MGPNTMKFTKMHGLGNDYVYVNAFDESLPDDLPALATAISDRHRGVGSDGLILILPPDNPDDAHLKMRMFNADGSEAEMCGNGIRCLAKYAVDHKLTDQNPIRVETGAGTLSIQHESNGDGKLTLATVNMGAPILTPSEIPVDLGPDHADLTQIVNHPIDNLFSFPGDAAWFLHAGLDFNMTAVSMGNPHVIIYCQNVNEVPLEQVGPYLETHKVFPARINVHFVQIHSPDEVTMRTWERGSGITQACGTGACAVCVAGVITEKSNPKITAHLLGGDLTLEYNQPQNHILMTGPATEIFSGIWIT